MKLTSAAMNTNQEPQRFPASGAAPCYVAALFVQPDGCYAGWPWIDAWDAEGDKHAMGCCWWEVVDSVGAHGAGMVRCVDT